MNVISKLTIILLLLNFSHFSAQSSRLNLTYSTDELNDFYTPQYYLATDGDSLKNLIDNFVNHARKISFKHPLENSAGEIPDYSVPIIGEFASG